MNTLSTSVSLKYGRNLHLYSSNYCEDWFYNNAKLGRDIENLIKYFSLIPCPWVPYLCPSLSSTDAICTTTLFKQLPRLKIYNSSKVKNTLSTSVSLEYGRNLHLYSSNHCEDWFYNNAKLRRDIENFLPIKNIIPWKQKNAITWKYCANNKDKREERSCPSLARRA